MGDPVSVVVAMDTCQLVAGFQAFIAFDPDELAYDSGDYTRDPFGQPIIDPIVEGDPGEIDLASGIDQTIGQVPVDGTYDLAELTFIAQRSFCLPQGLSFRENVPPTRLTDPEGGEALTNLLTELPPSCYADTNLSGAVDVDDLMAVVMDWGNTEPCGTDTNGDNVVNVDDLIDVILFWGPCD